MIFLFIIWLMRGFRTTDYDGTWGKLVSDQPIVQCIHGIVQKRCIDCFISDQIYLCKYSFHHHGPEILCDDTRRCDNCKDYDDPFDSITWTGPDVDGIFTVSYRGEAFFKCGERTQHDLNRMTFALTHFLQSKHNALEQKVNLLQQTVADFIQMIEFHPDGAEAEEAIKRVRHVVEEREK